MDLLPKDHQEFRQKEYWDNFFKKRGKKAFEWYGEYAQLCGILHKYIKSKDNVLVVGCGNSTMSCDLFDVGYKNITNIDVSNQVVEQMQRQNKRDRPDLKFETMDATKMNYDESTFSVVLDKGTLDAMMTDDSDEVKANVNLMFSEIDRVLRFAGRYIVFSLLQPHILGHAVESFASDRGWPVRIVRCTEADGGKSEEERQFPVFALIATKFKKVNEMIPVLEMGLSSDGQLTRFKTTNDLVGSVRGIQQFAAVRAGVVKGNLFQDSDARHADPSLDLLAPTSTVGGKEITLPRYSMFIVESDKAYTIKFSIFIVPQGREAEWLFSTKQGRSHLAGSTGCKRMVVVHLHREHVYKSLDSIKEELSGYALEFAPSDLEANVQVPFLSLGEDEVGDRTERCRGKSDISGEFVVEDVSANGKLFRRLIFFNNKKLIQSEAKLKMVKTKKKTKKVVDTSYLSCAHHSVMIGSLGFFGEETPKEIRCLIVGLGGGALPSYISNHFLRTIIDTVEIDEAIVRVATEHFEFKTNERLNVITNDGIKYIQDYPSKLDQNGFANTLYDVIMFDVDSKDSTIGMSCPPKPFVEPAFLLDVSRCLNSNGIFVLNVTCRDPILRTEVLEDVKKVFKGDLLTYQIPQEVNEIIFCWKNSLSGIKTKINKKHPAIIAFESTNKTVKDDLLDISEAMAQVRIV